MFVLRFDAVKGGRKRVRDFASIELLRIFCHRMHVTFFIQHII